MLHCELEAPTTSALLDVTDRNNSFYVAGTVRSGKSMVVANILRQKLEQYPNATVLVFDPKGDSKEDGYWDHPQIQRHSFRGMTATATVWEEETKAFLAKATQAMGQVDIYSDKRLFIVFEELLACKQRLSKETFSELVRACSNSIHLGDSEGIHAIVVTQSTNAGDSFGSQELIKNMCLVATLRQDEFSRAQKMLKVGMLNTDNLTEEAFDTLRKASPVNRVLAVGGEFISMPRLTNYSGYDRDTNSYVEPLAS